MHIKLQTKLHKPRLAHDLVPRQRLLNRLDEGLTQPLTLVVAPAGFGKTSLVVDWLATVALPAAWLSLDEEDNTLTGFVGYTAAAIETAFPGACSRTQVLLQGEHDAPANVLVTGLINDIAGISQDFVLVLDDYHTVLDRAIHDAVVRLIRHHPAQLHLVLVSRADPPLALEGLRAAHMTELRTGDLRFSREETQAFVTNAAGLQLNAEDLAQLDERMEGWVAGLRLALFSLKDRRDPATLIEMVSGADRHIMAYLLSEVLNRLPPDVRRMLLCTSILDRFCADECDAISAVFGANNANDEPCMDGAAFIAWLEHTELFITPLDGERRWFRLHHLFQQLLRHRLAEVTRPQTLAALHASAGAWCARHGLVDAAINHALAAGDQEMAVQIVVQHAHDALNHEDFRTLRRWLGALPAGAPEQPASLLTYLQGRYAAMGPAIARAEARAIQEQRERPECACAEEAELRRRIYGEVACLKAIHAYITGDANQPIVLTTRALADLPQSCAYMRSAAIVFRAASQQRLGQFDVVEQWLTDELNRCGDVADTYSTRIAISLCVAYRDAGLFVHLKATAERLLHMAEKSGLLLSECWARLFLGVVSYEWNALDDAVAHLSHVRDHRYGVTMLIARRALIALARAQQAQGRGDDARRTHEMLVKYQLDMADSIDEETQALGARLALLSGQRDSAIAWAHGARLDLPPQFSGDDISHLIYADMLLAEGTPSSRRQALDTIEQVSQAAAEVHTDYLHTQTLARKALACEALGQRKAATETLREALALARPGGLVRTFVDLGPAMERLLLRSAKRGQINAHLARILGAFAQARAGTRSNGHSAFAQRNGAYEDATMADLLTPREAEILRLLQQGLSNKQIARQLVITPETVQRHASNIFAKLDVHNRRQAVSKARAMGLLA